MKTNQPTFTEIIGQTHVIQKLNFYLDGYAANSYFPNTLFLSSKGMGKTEIVRATGRELALIASKKGNKKVFLELNCSTLKSVDQFFSKVLQPYCSADNHATLFLDEIHTLSNDIVMFLLSVMNPTKSNKNIITNNGFTLTVDFNKLTIFAASTEPQLIFKALADRFNRIYLSEYNQNELAQIIARNVDSKVLIDDQTLNELARYSGGNGRSSMLLAKDGVNVYAATNKRKNFTKKDLRELILKLDLFEGGISRFEVQLLKMIANCQDGRCTLTTLCSKSGLTKSAGQTMENSLLKAGYIEISGKRGLTQKGINFLETNKNRLNN